MNNFQKSIPAIMAILMIVMIPLLIGCSKDETIPAPVINTLELGYQNSHSVAPGNHLHIEADIVADGKIQNIFIEIHPEGGHLKYQTSSLSSIPWEFDSIYTGVYAGVKNTTFHEHIDVPADADTGHYHFHFIVTDMEGNQTLHEEELHVKPE